jgi:transposase, IS30 family
MLYTHFTRDDRVMLARLLAGGKTQKACADIIGKSTSAVSREIEEYTDPDGVYRAGSAHKKACAKRKNAKHPSRKIENNAKLRRYIVTKLKRSWSPEQIAGRWQREHGKGTISHETIYQFIYNDRIDLKIYLRCTKGRYRRRYGTKKREKQRELAKRRSIEERPEQVGARTRIGDWEGDTIIGAEKNQRILTHVDRKSGLLLADKLDVVSAEIVQKTATKRFRRIKRAKRTTITYDRGTEFSDHERIERNTKTQVYFCNPYHSWERGTNENTNGLLRWFFPKKTLFATITQQDVRRAERLLNTRPRKRHNYLTPLEVFNESCASS